jgi:hypothetical protein
MTEWIEKEIPIAEIDILLENGYEVEVDSPDGWVGVNHFVNKGMWDEYVLKIDGFDQIRCNENHLFETTLGWRSAIELRDKGEINILTKHGFRRGVVIRTYEKIPIVDINVNHENHRYYTADISSHNTGVGKSLFMCHCAAANISIGQNVLYITMEMAEEKIAERIDANLLNVDIADLQKLSKDMYDKKINQAKNKAHGKLIIKEYPTASASTQHFRNLINELRLKKSFVPDVIYVDYLNICASARIKPGSNVNSYTYVKSIAEELRGLAVEFGVPLISATQTTRSGYASSDVELTDTSESFGLPATADFMFALTTNETLEQLGQMQIKQLKNRYNDPTSNKRFIIGVDRAKMRLYDVENSAQDLVDSGQDDPETKSFRKIGSDDRFISDMKNKFKNLKVI